MFQVFNRNGLNAALEEHTAATLEQPDRLALHAILEENMMPIYGKQEWEEEAKADKVKELEEADTRLLIIRASAADSPASSPVSKPKADAEPEAGTEKSEPSAAVVAAAAGKFTRNPPDAWDLQVCSDSFAITAVTPTKPAKVSTDVLGFMHYRFEVSSVHTQPTLVCDVYTLSDGLLVTTRQVENDALVVYIYELQIANREETRRKGLGKFLLLLTEMIARKHSFGGVMLTCQRTNPAGQKFCERTSHLPLRQRYVGPFLTRLHVITDESCKCALRGMIICHQHPGILPFAQFSPGVLCVLWSKWPS